MSGFGCSRILHELVVQWLAEQCGDALRYV